ncbi:MAG: DUF362 domain-containing protein, partial [Proteobacteria bacterium]|nr:DUF362 domain-containing protein [Pseudomonadota bacterium]
MDWLATDARWPLMGLARQSLDATGVGDLEAALRGELAILDAQRRLSPGSTVAVAVGSRRIDQGAAIVRTVVQTLREWGLDPFLVPAMGSHGGAFAEGQRKTLARLGITEESVGAPIKASLEVAALGALADGTPVVMGLTAAQADAVLIVNRVKSHTKFFGRIESGLLKMTAIGLGQRQGAARLHAAAVDLGLEDVIRAAARVIIDSGRIWGGLGVVENGQGRVALVKGLAAAEIEPEEEKLLERAKAMAPRIPFDKIDLLIVDRIGKDISGIGM